MSIENEYVHSEAEIEGGSVRENRALWIGILGGPVIWLTQFQINYMLVPWSCTTGNHWALYLCTVTFLAAGLLPAYCAWKHWRAAGSQRPRERESVKSGRRNFMALLGLMMSGLFLLLIFAQGIPSLFLDPCQQ